MTIAVHSREKITVSDAELSFLTTVTQLASIAVEKANESDWNKTWLSVCAKPSTSALF